MSGYQTPLFHTNEHLTYDYQGFFYWKGCQVDHYTPRWAYSEDAHRRALDLAERCKHLEAIGEEVNGATAIWDWELYAERKPPERDLGC